MFQRDTTYPEMSAITRIAVPVIGSQLASMAMGVTDVIMAGRLSAKDLAAVAVGSSFQMPLFVCVMGMLMSLNPVVAHLFGAKKEGEISGKFHQGLWLALACSVPAVLALRYSIFFLNYLGIEAEVATLAANYLKALSWGYPMAYLFLANRFFIEGLSQVKPTLIITIAVVPLNVLGNYVLMYGKLGFPKLGAVGTGYSSSFNMLVMFLILIAWTFRYNGARYNLIRFIKPHWLELRELLAIGVPNAVSLGMEVTMFAMMAMFIGAIGETEVGAHQIALNLASVTFMVPLGASIAIGIRIGQAAGRGDEAAVDLTARTGFLMTFCIQACVGATIALFNNFFVGLYTHDLAVSALATKLLYFAAVFQISDGLQVVGMGALRGVKDTRIPMFANTFAYWGVGLPLGYLLGFPLGWGPSGFWMGMVVSLSLAASLHLWRFHRVRKRLIRSVSPTF